MADEPLDVARRIEAVRQKRLRFFNPKMFDEHGWEILLLVFIAGEEGHPLNRNDLIATVDCSIDALDRWLSVLEHEGLIEGAWKGSGDLNLSADGRGRLLETLAVAD